MVAAAAPDGRDRATLRREQLATDRVKARQKPPEQFGRIQRRLSSLAVPPDSEQRVVTKIPPGSTSWSTGSCGISEQR
jgi:hypothetical protein